MKIKSIAINGVDGTGKSTVVDILVNDTFRNKAVVQYMGLKQWETYIAKFVYEMNSTSKVMNVVKKVLKPFATIHDIRHRIYKYRKTNKIIIFDRYSYEQILQFEKYGRTIYNRPVEFLYNIFLEKYIYRPTLVVYLYCDRNISLARKRDIATSEVIKRFDISKKSMDNYFNRIECYRIDTSFYNPYEVSCLVKDAFLNKINKDGDLV